MIVSDFNRDEYRWYLRQIADSNPDRAGELISLLALRAAARSLPFAFTHELFDWVGSREGSQVTRLAELLEVYGVLNGKSVENAEMSACDYYSAARYMGKEYSTAKYSPSLMSIYSCSYASAARAFSDDINVTIGYALAAVSASIIHPSLLDEASQDIQGLIERYDVSALFKTRLFRNPPELLSQGLGRLENFFAQIPERDTKENNLRGLVDANLDFIWQALGFSRPKHAGKKADHNRASKGLSETSNFLSTNQFHPESPSAIDKLNRQKLVNALAINLTHSTNKHHRAIGLLGEWGSGKSTVLKLLKQKLKETYKEQPFVFGELNAWAYEHSDNIQAGIAQEVLNAVTTVEACEVPAKEKDEKRAVYLMRTFRLRILNALWRPIKSLALRPWITFWYALRTQKLQLLKSVVVLFVALLPAMLASQKIDPDWFSWLGKLSNNNKTLLDNLMFQLVWGFGFGVYFLKEIRSLMANPLSKELLTYIRLPDYAKHLGEIPVMRKNIKVMCDIRLGRLCGKPKRMLFVVDDLDRCSPEAIVKVLEALRLVLDLENVVVLIAIDQHIALAALSDHFKDFSPHHKLKNSHAIAREYLSKVINLPIVLTAPSGDDVHVFMADLWKDMPKDSTVGASGTSREDPVDNTPRQVTGETNLPAVDSKTQPDNVPVADGSPNSDFLEDVKLTIPEADQQPRGQINPIKALSQEQRQSFIYWVNYFELTNPRQLKRLNNSYDLMRSYFIEWDKTSVAFNFPSENSKLVYPMLLTLVLMEYLNSFEDLEARGRIWRKLFSDQSLVKFSPSENITIVDAGVFGKQLVSTDFIKAYSEMLELQEYKGLPSKVEAFVLPAMT